MKKADAEAFAKKLIKRGYRKWDNSKYGQEDYDVSLAIRNEEGFKALIAQVLKACGTDSKVNSSVSV